MSRSNAQVALSAASSFYTKQGVSTERVFELADKYKEWLDNHDSTEVK